MQQQPREICAACQEAGHGATVCPMALEVAAQEQEGNYMGAYQQRQWDNPYSNSYNHGWHNHPNFSWKPTGGQPYALN